MSLIVVGIGDCRTSADRKDILATYALGSCICVTVHDPVAGVAGLLHLLLPESSLDPARAKENPFVFADTGIPVLLERVYCLGARKERMTVTLMGGSQMAIIASILNIGAKNIQASREMLAQAGVVIKQQAVGGSVARTVKLRVDTGGISIHETPASVSVASLCW